LLLHPAIVASCCLELLLPCLLMPLLRRLLKQ
jgi:hypothetical protein